MDSENKDNLDDFLNDFEFKPITKGLGFHHGLEDESNIEASLAKKSADLEKSFRERATRLRDSAPKESTSMNMGDLAPFYNTTEIEENPVELDLGLETSESLNPIVYANISSRLLAYGIDFLVVGSLLSLYMLGVALSTGLGLDSILNLNQALVLETMVLGFVLFYLFYFSFLDKTTNSTLGKSLLNIRIQNTNNENPTVIQSFVRSLISLISLGTLGLLTLTKAVDAISGTIVIKK